MKKLFVILLTAIIAGTLSVSVFAVGTNIAPEATVDAPYCSAWESVGSITDGKYADVTYDTSGQYPHYGSFSMSEYAETITFTWDTPVTVDSLGIFLWNDQPRDFWLNNGGINSPAAYSIQYLNEKGQYVDVANGKGYEVLPDVMNVTEFDEVTTTSIQITLKKYSDDELANNDVLSNEAHANICGLGVYEIEIYEVSAEDTYGSDATEGTDEAPQTGFTTAILAVFAITSGAYIVTKKH